MNKPSLPKIKCQRNEITTYEIPTTNYERRKSMKLKNKIKKVLPFIIGVYSISICLKVYSIVEGNNDDSPLLEQIENAYDLNVTGIEAAGGSAIDVVNEDNLTDYLPVTYSQYLTSVINTEDNMENVIEEITLDIPNDNGDYNYILYNYLANTSTQGTLCSSDLDDYYFTQQENLLVNSVTDTDFYIGIPGKNWTLTSNTDDTTHKIFIAPEFYTVTTPHGTYENCLLKYEHTSSENASWANSNTFTAFAPYGVGKVYSITFSESSPETPITYYTYIPEDSYSEEPNDTSSSSMELSSEIQNILNNSKQYTSDNGLILAISNGTTDLWVINPVSDMINYHGNIGTQKNRDGWPVTGDSSLGCGNEILNFYDLDNGLRQTTLTMWDDIYFFTENL